MIKKKLFIFLAITYQLSAISYVMAQTGTLKGKVTDSTGTAVEAAVVSIENTKYLASTDTKGNYKIENVPAGNYSVVAQIVGYNPVEKQTVVTANYTTELDFNLLQKVNQLKRVEVVRPFVSGQGMGHMPETYQGVIYSGMKTEVLVLDSVDANKAQDNFRETLGRLPGSNYSETEGGGFPSNGIAFRGLIPTQSVEIQTRQNGYNLAADVYGYPESYYLPPLIAVSQIQVFRGEASLQYGPQFGGVIDYEIKDGPLNKPLEIGVEETGGSYDFTSSVLSLGGTYKKWHYFAFGQFKYTNGWRPNSDVSQGTAFAKLEYDASDKFKVSLEYTLLRNRIHMAGGLTDSEFHENPDQSVRARNWLTSPWNLLALTATYKLTDKTELILKSVGNVSARYLVWKNEDGGPEALDTDFSIPRQVDKENFVSITNELRLLSNYHIGSVQSTFAAGIRYFQGEMWREEEGVGSAGAGYDFSVISENGISSWQDSSYFTTVNIAPFIENSFHFGKLTVIPGFRYEYIQSTASGYTETENLVRENYSTIKTWYIPLAGCALQYKTSDFTNIYGNIAQAYEPTTYEALTPIGVALTINPNLQDVSGFNSDLGWRGKAGKFINFDVDVFYLAFNNEIGFQLPTTPGGNEYETNIGDAVHKGVETYLEIHAFKMLRLDPRIGDFSFFNSYAYDDSRYITGPFAGNYEEMAPIDIERVGINYSFKKFSTTFLYSYSSKSYADANNSVLPSSNPAIGSEVGLIPAYTVVDWSSSYKYKKYALTFGISNLLNVQYFNLRTTEYPGPGIIPAPGRNFYVGLSATF